MFPFQRDRDEDHQGRKDENNLYTLSNYFPPSPFDSQKN